MASSAHPSGSPTSSTMPLTQRWGINLTGPTQLAPRRRLPSLKRVVRSMADRSFSMSMEPEEGSDEGRKCGSAITLADFVQAFLIKHSARHGDGEMFAALSKAAVDGQASQVARLTALM